MFITGDVELVTFTTFSDTNNGITATFSSPANPGGFVTAVTFLTFGPEILYSPGNLDPIPQIPLNISFSIPVASISMDFATDGGDGTLQLMAFLGSTAVGVASVVGSTTTSFYPEGVMNFGGTTFDSVILAIPGSPFFAIANVDVVAATTAVPEPSSWILSATSLAVGLILFDRSRVTGRRPMPMTPWETVQWW